MKNFKLSAVAAVAASLAAAGASAAVTISAATPVAVKYASEIVATVAAPVTIAANAATDITTEIGYSLSLGEVRYVRVELANGVFAANTVVTSAHANAALGAVNGIGTSVIYFSLTAINGTLPSTGTLNIASDIKITGTTSNVTASYSVYDQPSQAQSGGTTGRIVSIASAPYINFVKSFGFTATSASAVADVAAANGAFTAFTNTAATGTPSIALLASAVNFDLIAAPPLNATSSAITLAQLFNTTTTKIVVTATTGDFSAAANANGTYNGAALNRVYLSASATCATVDKPASALTSSTATFIVGATATTGTPVLCYAPLGVAASQIAASTFTADLIVGAASATYAPTNVTGVATGTITRNGTELQAPLFQTTTGYVSRFFLSNTGSVAATVQVSVKTEANTTANTVALTNNTIPAGGSLEIPASTIVSSFTSAAASTPQVGS